MRYLLVLLACGIGFISCHKQEPEITSDTYAHNFMSIADTNDIKQMHGVAERLKVGQLPVWTPSLLQTDWSFLQRILQPYRMPGSEPPFENTGSVYIPPPLDLRTIDTSGTPRVYIND